jgi:hypothetical protein
VTFREDELGNSPLPIARRWQQQFCKWRAQQGPGPYFALTTRREQVSTSPEVWEIIIMTHQSARSGLTVHDRATGSPLDMDRYDDVIKARSSAPDNPLSAPRATDEAPSFRPSRHRRGARLPPSQRL